MAAAAKRARSDGGALPAALAEKVAQWLAWDPDASTRAELTALRDAGDVATLEKRFASRIAFGTAGLRGLMAAGPACMNQLTVLQASQGLTAYLEDTLPDAKTRGVVVGYDGRHNSLLFARTTAATLLSRGFRVSLYGGVTPTPLVPFWVGKTGAAAGVMVTASHNPKQDNGYKVYWGNACQIIPPHDKGIAASIDRNQAPWPGVDYSAPPSPLLSDPLTAASAAYVDAIGRLCYHKSENKGAPAVCYTAMHGVGRVMTERAFAAFGLKPFVPVVEQCEPDPEFPTVPFPNPEEGKGALKLAMATADAAGAKLIVANDPDADRLAIAEKDASGAWYVFTGNEIGILFGWWMWRHRHDYAPGVKDSDFFMSCSTVSSQMLGALCRAEGCAFTDTLTGFKWLGNSAIDAKARGLTPLLSFEESIGYMPGDVCWDKDGVRAAAMAAEMNGVLAREGKNLAMQLAELRQRYGYYCGVNSYFLCYEKKTMDAIFERLRGGFDGGYPKTVRGFAVASVRDLTTGYDSSQPDGKAVLPPSSYMITFKFANGCTATLRGSGTEPKLKYYIELVGKADAADAARSLLSEMTAAIIAELLQPEKNGLVAKKD